MSILEPEQYSIGQKPAFNSTIGAHFRHVLEHYRCLMLQIPVGVFCYDDRERDQSLECDLHYARQTIGQLKRELSELDPDMFRTKFMLKDQQTADLIETSLHRELVFLQAHTVHHYAIIAAMTRALGKQPEHDFGIAIATRTFDAETSQGQPHPEDSVCAQ